MRSRKRGNGTSEAEVTNVSPFGLWILLDGRELFLPFEDFPWFEDATIRAIGNVQRLGRDHLHWPDLDVDLSVDSIEHPERYPLKSRVQPKKPAPPARARKRRAAGNERRPGRR